MVRGYLNSLSFPAKTIDDAVALLARLRSGMALLIQREFMSPTIMCAWRAADLPLTAAYQTLRDVAKTHRGQFRDTILFFLTALDQRSPVTAELDETAQAEADPHVVEGLGVDLHPAATMTLVACALDHGVLLSLGTAMRWQKDRVDFHMLTRNSMDGRPASIDNVCDEQTAAVVIGRLEVVRNEFTFLNWNHLTDGALRSEQVGAWFERCRRQPGLEQVIMRSVHLASQAEYRPDGDLIKKLVGGRVALFEIRIYHAGSNNVRLLFTRDPNGRAIYGYGGAKTSDDWYETAIPQALAQIERLGG